MERDSASSHGPYRSPPARRSWKRRSLFRRMVRRTWIWTLNGTLLYIGIQLMSWIHTSASIMVSGRTSTSKPALYGCKLGDWCTMPGEFCFAEKDRGGGALWCDGANSSNEHYVTSCVAGYYCGADAFSDGCTDKDGHELICLHARKELIPAD